MCIRDRAYPDKSEAEAAIRNLVKEQKALADDIAGAEEACHESEKTLAALEATIAEAQRQDVYKRQQYRAGISFSIKFPEKSLKRIQETDKINMYRRGCISLASMPLNDFI